MTHRFSKKKFRSQKRIEEIMSFGYTADQIRYLYLIFSAKICPYCKGKTEYIDSLHIYGKSYGMIYICKKCRAYVGVHAGTNKALGRLANDELRKWKKEAHHYFDQICKSNLMSRKKAYSWLSKNLNIPPSYTHIGMFGVETCKKVVELCKKELE